MSDEYPPKSGILPQYANLKGMAENMPIIRKLLGLSEYGQIPTNTAIGRALQRFTENDSKDVVCESRINKQPTLEQRGQTRYVKRADSHRIIDSSCQGVDEQ